MKLTLRLPDDLYEKLKEVAKAGRRSMNTEANIAIEAWCQAAYLKTPDPTVPPPSHQVDTNETAPDLPPDTVARLGTEAPPTVSGTWTPSTGQIELPPLDAQGIAPDAYEPNSGTRAAGWSDDQIREARSRVIQEKQDIVPPLPLVGAAQEATDTQRRQEERAQQIPAMNVPRDKPACTCPAAEKRKGKHNKWCPARGA